MSSFKYDEFEFQDDGEEEKEQERMMDKQREFQENYQQLMREEVHQTKQKVQEIQPKQVQKQKQSPVRRQPSREKVQVEQKVESKREAKPPPAPRPMREDAKGKLIDQHLKLKSQLTELASKMDDIVDREREKRRKKLNARSEEEDERVVSLKSELREQEADISKNKAAIEKLRKNLDYKYDVHKIVEKENELKLLKEQVKALEAEKSYLLKINKEEREAKDSEDTDLKRMNDRMKAEISELTQKNKAHIDSINEREKQMRRLHESNITKEEKIKEIEGKLNAKKEAPQSSDLTYSISELEEKIKELEERRRESEAQGQERLNEITREKKRLKYQYDKKVSYLEEKEKELKINKIQYQDILRLINAANSHSSSNANPNAGSGGNKKKEAPDETPSKGSDKRKVNKGGRQRPKIPKPQEQMTESVVENEGKKENQGSVKESEGSVKGSVKSVKELHEVGVGSDMGNNEDEEYGNGDFEEEEEVRD